MKVDIEHYEMTTGMFRKTTHYGVKLTVQFNAEELHTIKTKKLEDTFLVDRPPMSVLNSPGDRDLDALKLKALIPGKETAWTFATPAAARQYEEDIKEMLPKLKGFISNNADITEKKTSFEL